MSEWRGLGFARRWMDLAGMDETQLRAEHDQLAAQNPVVGVSYYLDELRRREAQRQGDRIERLTWVMAFLTAVITVATVALVLRGG